MVFYAELTTATKPHREELMRIPVIEDCLSGKVGLATYVAFLTEAYHHVKHTVPLLMACGARLPDRLGWLQQNIIEYIDEEQGHERWILNDISACGAEAAVAAEMCPSVATEVMVSYAYDTIARRNPIGFFGMVFVLEGTSVAIATRAADVIERELGLPRSAFSYLRSHGSVDQKHIGDYERIVNRLDDERDRLAVIRSAQIFFKLYGDIFRQLPRAPAAASQDVKEVA